MGSLCCASIDASETAGTFERRTLPLESGEKPIGEIPSPYALELRWEGDAGGKQIDALSAIVENTTGRSIKADLVLLVHAPDGQLAEQILETREFQARETVRLSVSARSLPLQSSGVASGVSMEVRYEVNVRTIEDLAGRSAHTVINRTPTIYVAHSEDFETATIRSVTEEERFNGKLREEGKSPKLGEIRGRLARQDTQSAAAAGGVMTILRLPASSPMSPTPPTVE